MKKAVKGGIRMARIRGFYACSNCKDTFIAYVPIVTRRCVLCGNNAKLIHKIDEQEENATRWRKVLAEEGVPAASIRMEKGRTYMLENDGFVVAYTP